VLPAVAVDEEVVVVCAEQMLVKAPASVIPKSRCVFFICRYLVVF